MTITQTIQKDGFVYTLWKDGTPIQAYKSIYPYRFGIVTVSNDKITLEFKALKNIHFSDIEDDNIYLIDVTLPVVATI
jgi:hypothetical protein